MARQGWRATIHAKPGTLLLGGTTAVTSSSFPTKKDAEAWVYAVAKQPHAGKVTYARSAFDKKMAALLKPFRGGGKKRSGGGKKVSHLDRPRLRFNWGYHDAANYHERGAARLLIEHGQQDLRHVSRDFDDAFYEGYSAGLRDARHGAYQGNSDAAWREYVAENPSMLAKDKRIYHDAEVQEFGHVGVPYRIGGKRRHAKATGGKHRRSGPMPQWRFLRGTTSIGVGAGRTAKAAWSDLRKAITTLPRSKPLDVRSEIEWIPGGKRRHATTARTPSRLGALVSDINRLTK